MKNIFPPSKQHRIKWRWCIIFASLAWPTLASFCTSWNQIFVHAFHCFCCIFNDILLEFPEQIIYSRWHYVSTAHEIVICYILLDNYKNISFGYELLDTNFLLVWFHIDCSRRFFNIYFIFIAHRFDRILHHLKSMIFYD